MTGEKAAVFKRTRRTIAIAGAGIAGLCAALALERKGYRVVVFEKLLKPSFAGTGIQLSPNAYHVLAKLGVANAISVSASTPEAIEIHSAQSGKVLNRFDLSKSFTNRHQAPYSVLHRADLMQVLLAACERKTSIELRFAETVVDVAAYTKGVTVLVSNGEQFHEVQAHALIGADGVWSKLRALIQGGSEPKFSGHVAWRGILPMDDVPAAISRSNTGLWLGPKSHVVHYPIRNSSHLNVIAIVPWTEEKPPTQNWLVPDQKPANQRTFQHWYKDVRMLVMRDVSWGGWPIWHVPKLGAIHNGPLCLIGDAAHPMQPFAAQGGACGIEDAAVLAHCFDNQDSVDPAPVQQVFAQFQKQRQARVNRMIRLAEQNRQMYHLDGTAAAIRNAVLRFTPQAALQKKMDWLYGWKPPSD